MLKRILSQRPHLPITKSEFKKIPEVPGIYIFFLGKEALYVGKAKSLRSRLNSYLTIHIGPKTRKMLTEAEYFIYVKSESELEALLLEAELIRSEQPPYNTVAKDDKHPLYIKITREKYPRVITARKSDQLASLVTYGPFPSSTNVRSGLRMLRKIIPYSDHKLGKKACIYSQIGFCNPCPSSIEAQTDIQTKQALRRKYRSNLRMLKNILSRRSKAVIQSLYRQMAILSKNQGYEAAAQIREKIQKLEYILQPITPVSDFIENPNLSEDILASESNELEKVISKYLAVQNKLARIECFDVAHLGGTKQTASMVTFINGQPEKSLYRHFKIRTIRKADDIAAMREIAARRVKSLRGWGRPDLIVVDGGKAQVTTFREVFLKEGVPVVGLAKRMETLVIPNPQGVMANFVEVRLKPPALNLIQRLRDEAHRFARRYHHFLVKKDLIS